MKHAGSETLGALAPLLEKVRRHTALREKKTGIFYLGSKAFLHFHEDAAGVFADAKLGEDFTRMRVSTQAEQRTFLAKIAAHFNSLQARRST